MHVGVIQVNTVLSPQLSVIENLSQRHELMKSVLTDLSEQLTEFSNKDTIIQSAAFQVLEQRFLELLNNSLDAKATRFSIECIIQEDKVVIKIADNGKKPIHPSKTGRYDWKLALLSQSEKNFLKPLKKKKMIYRLKAFQKNS